MNTFLKYYSTTAIIALITFIAIFITTGDPTLVFAAIALSVIEISLSMDNAIVNAGYLKQMNHFWKRVFLYFGIFIAVIGMRFYFPIEMVSIAGNVPLSTAFDWALNSPDQFAHTLESSHTMLAGFGGAFLMLVALKYFVDSDRDEYWLSRIERPLSKLGLVDEIQILLTGTIFYIVSTYLDHDQTTFFLAAITGIAVHIAVDILKHGLEHLGHSSAPWTSFIKGGLGTFIFLEVLDSSFSLDGAIAAFAISNNIFVIAAGLGIGALVVRSMTIMLDDMGTLNLYRYLETGAFYSILFLALTILASMFIEIPDYIVALGSIGIISSSLIHSIIENKRNV